MTNSTKPKRNVFLFIPNILGYIRVLMIIWSLVYINSSPLTFLAISFFSCLIDLFDGPIARYLNQTSNFGALFDVVIDNICRATLWIAAVYYCHSYYYHACNQDRYNNMTIFESIYCYIIFFAAIYFITMAWFCLIATEVDAIKSKTHWKKRQETTNPKIIQKVFANGFHNRYGFVVIGSTFALPWWICVSFIGYSNIFVSGLVAFCWFGCICCDLIVWYIMIRFLSSLDDDSSNSSNDNQPNTEKKGNNIKNTSKNK